MGFITAGMIDFLYLLQLAICLLSVVILIDCLQLVFNCNGALKESMFRIDELNTQRSDMNDRVLVNSNQFVHT